MGLASLPRFQLCAYLLSPGLQPTFIPWQRRWRPTLPSRGLCWRSIIAVTASPHTIAQGLGAPSHVIFRMLANIAIDRFVGAVPLLGDAFDVMWRSNRRNMRLLREWLAREDGNWRP